MSDVDDLEDGESANDGGEGDRPDAFDDFGICTGCLVSQGSTFFTITLQINHRSRNILLG